MGSPSADLIAGRNHAPKNLGRVLVLGLGVSGRAVARYLVELLGTRVETLHIAAGASNEAALAFGSECEAAGATVAFDTEQVSGTFDLAIASPGISENSAFFACARAASAEIVSEVEFAWRESSDRAKWLAVTGTNGKTTTTALLAHLMQTCGYAALPVGNIGKACIEAVAEDACTCYVAEVSSYQLASTSLFAPDVAVMLNITPDHLAWHGSFDAYVQAKRRLLAGLGSRCGARAVFDAANDVVRSVLRECSQRGMAKACVPVGAPGGYEDSLRSFGEFPHAAFVRASDGMLVCVLDNVEYELCTRDELKLVGMHNVGNALHAAAAALCAGAPAAGVAEGLRSFSSLEHRIEPCGEAGGVRYFNDSKATNVDATLKALEAFAPERPIVLLGGQDKGTDLADLVASAQKHAKAVVCYGELRPRFEQAFSGSGVSLLLAERLADALASAEAIAQQGDIVLLSPACASFDEFDSFEHRGRVFKQLVAKRLRKG